MADTPCPPPEAQWNHDGTITYKPHCWTCAAKLASLRQANNATPPASPRRRIPWPSQDVANFLLNHGRGTGRTYAQLVETYSSGKVTKDFTEEEFTDRVNNLYAMKPELERQVEALTDGRMELRSRRIAFGFQANGKPKSHTVLLVAPRQVKPDAVNL